MSVRLSLGDCVLVKTDQFKDHDTGSDILGLIKYIGYIQGQNCMKQYVGIELIEAIKNGHDGTIDGYRYFTAPKGHGVHLQITDIIKKLSVEEVLTKFKDIVTFFKTKLSQYMSALTERDDYIEKLKQKQKHLKSLLNESAATLQQTVSHIASVHNYKRRNNKNDKITSDKDQLQKSVTPLRNMYEFMAMHDNDPLNSSLHIAPITPMTPFEPLNICNNDSNGTAMTSSSTNNMTPITTPNMRRNKNDHSNSTSYASTNENSHNTNTCTQTGTTTNASSIRAILELEVIPDAHTAAQELMINTNYNGYNMQPQMYAQNPMSPQVYYTPHKSKAIQSPILYQVIPQNKVIMPSYVRYQPQQLQPHEHNMYGENISKHMKENKNKQYIEKQSGCVAWNESKYCDIAALQSSGYVISNQYY